MIGCNIGYNSFLNKNKDDFYIYFSDYYYGKMRNALNNKILKQNGDLIGKGAYFEFQEISLRYSMRKIIISSRLLSDFCIKQFEFSDFNSLVFLFCIKNSLETQCDAI